jgi:hypothetical protein
MGEAKRRREHRAQATPSIPDDIKADIANAVGCVGLISKRTGDMGTCCMTRSVLGYLVMREIGLDGVEYRCGHLLYRVSPTRCFRFGAEHNNIGYIDEATDKFYGHAWLEYGGDIIDFSTRDWVFLSDDTWAVSPPPFVWQPKVLLAGNWQPVGQPSAVGEMWYGPWRGPRKSISSLLTDRSKVISQALPHIHARIAGSNLKARIRAAMQGDRGLNG